MILSGNSSSATIASLTFIISYADNLSVLINRKSELVKIGSIFILKTWFKKFLNRL